MKTSKKKSRNNFKAGLDSILLLIKKVQCKTIDYDRN